MTLHNPRVSYWKLVSACLVAFFGYDQHVASGLIAAPRRRFEEGVISSGMDYHAEPVHVAEDIVGRRIQWTLQKKALYVTLRERVYKGISVTDLLKTQEDHLPALAKRHALKTVAERG